MSPVEIQTLLIRAQQGDPQAIASLLHHSTKRQGVTVRAMRQNSRLHVLLEADRVPNRQPAVAYVRDRINHWDVQSIETVLVYGKHHDLTQPDWSDSFQIQHQGIVERTAQASRIERQGDLVGQDQSGQDQSGQDQSGQDQSGQDQSLDRSPVMDIQEMDIQEIDAQMMDAQMMDAQMMDAQMMDAQMMDAQMMDAQMMDEAAIVSPFNAEDFSGASSEQPDQLIEQVEQIEQSNPSNPSEFVQDGEEREVFPEQLAPEQQEQAVAEPLQGNIAPIQKQDHRNEELPILHPVPYTPTEQLAVNPSTMETTVQAPQIPDFFKRPEAVAFILCAVILTLWDTYLAILNNDVDSLESLSASQLARRLGVETRQVRTSKRHECFSEWTQSLDPSGIGWKYQQGLYVPIKG